MSRTIMIVESISADGLRTVRRTSDQFGMRDVNIGTASLSRDEMSWSVPIVALTDAEEFEAFGTVKAYECAALEDGTAVGAETKIFEGTIVPAGTTGSGQTLSRAYRALNAWWLFEITNYFQSYTIGVEKDGSTICFLFLNTTSVTETVQRYSWPGENDFYLLSDGVAAATTYTWAPGTKLISCGQQIYDAISWLASEIGVNVALGQARNAVEPSGLYVSPVQKFDVKLSEVVRCALEKSPDVASRFDYSAATPTIYFEKQADMERVTLALGETVQAVDLTPMHELVTSAAHYIYVKTHSVDGATRKQVIHDVYPADKWDAANRRLSADALPGAAIQTIMLEGSQSSTSKMEFEGVLVNFSNETAVRTWFESHVEELADAVEVASWSMTFSGTGLGVNPATTGWTAFDLVTGAGISRAELQSGLWYEVTNGSLPPWLVSPANSKRARVIFRADVIGVTKGTVAAKPFYFDVTLTQLEPGNYKKLSSYTSAEPSPLDYGFSLARHVVNTLGRLYWTGTVTIKEQWPSSAVRVGNKLCLTGGDAAWATMDAIVQRVVKNFDTGTTTLQLGLPRWLGATELVDFLRLNRTRHKWADPQMMGDITKVGSNAEIEFPKWDGIKQVLAGGGTYETFNVMPKGGDPNTTYFKVNCSDPTLQMVLDTILRVKVEALAAGGKVTLLSGAGANAGTVLIDSSQIPSGKTAMFRTINGCFQNPDGSWSQKTMLVLGTEPA